MSAKKFSRSEKVTAVLVSAGILLVLIGALHLLPPDVHFTLDKETGQRKCVKVVRADWQGNPVDHPCSTIDLKHDSYNPVDVMGDDEIAEIKMAAAR